MPRHKNKSKELITDSNCEFADSSYHKSLIQLILRNGDYNKVAVISNLIKIYY